MSINSNETVSDESDFISSDRLKIFVYGKYAHKFAFNVNDEEGGYSTGILIDLLFAEYQLRYQAQLKDGWIQKEAPPGSHPTCIDHEDFKSICTTYVERLRALYLAESALPSYSVKSFYDSLRKDDEWYLRKELVNECVAAGGCCGWDCGCCSERLQDLPRKGISGHCSLSCPCCEKRNNCSLEKRKVSELDDEYRAALENPAFLLRMTRAYFSPIKSRSPCDRKSAIETPGSSQSTRCDQWSLSESTDLHSDITMPSSEEQTQTTSDGASGSQVGNAGITWRLQ